MSAATESVLPANELPLIRDPDLAHAIEMEVHGLSGKKLESAQAAIRAVHGSGVEGQFGELVAAYTEAIRAAIASD
jgi:hypothetical protein